MPVVETKGSASSQGFGEFAKTSVANYIEDVFSTYLYTGNSATQTITNGIDLAGEGGLVWIKTRTGTAYSHNLFDTSRGAGYAIQSNSSGTGGYSASQLTSFDATGFSLGSNAQVNGGDTFASWTFRKQAKFFDVVTYTGNGGSNRAISHSLGSVPGCYIIKATSTTSDWYVYHRGADGSGGGAYINQSGILNSTAAFAGSASDGLMPSSTAIYVVDSGSTTTSTNSNGETYVAYLFAHNAGGFGLTGSDNVISCGSFTTSGTAPNNATVNLGYEPQFLLYKISSSTGDWRIVDNMRGFTASGAATTSPQLRPNLTSLEQNNSFVQLTSTGFTTDTGVNAETYIYVAIRRGPMKTPTSGTSVFSPNVATPSTGITTINTGFAGDMVWMAERSAAVTSSRLDFDKLRGSSTTSGQRLFLNASTQELATVSAGVGFNNTTISDNVLNTLYGVTSSSVYWTFARAPGFFDVVCYTGTGSDLTLNHNLGVAPEAIILKKRSSSGDWDYDTNFTSTQHTYFTFNDTLAGGTTNYSSGIYLAAQPTSTTVTVAGGAYSLSGSTYVMYLFASCPGVSKVGTYSGTGATQTISCGFAARFVMIKRTDSTGSWWVWDTARGMVAGTDPRLGLNLTTAETNANWVYTDASGFQIVTTDASVNASGGTYIYLCVA